MYVRSNTVYFSLELYLIKLDWINLHDAEIERFVFKRNQEIDISKIQSMFYNREFQGLSTYHIKTCHNRIILLLYM